MDLGLSVLFALVVVFVLVLVVEEEGPHMRGDELDSNREACGSVAEHAVVRFRYGHRCDRNEDFDDIGTGDEDGRIKAMLFCGGENDNIDDEVENF